MAMKKHKKYAATFAALCLSCSLAAGTVPVLAAADAQKAEETATVAAPSGVEAKLSRSGSKNTSDRNVQVSLTWAYREQASGYWVYGKKKGAKNWVLLKKGISGNKNTCTYVSSTAILPLQAGKSYQFTVVSLDSSGNPGPFGTKEKQTPSVKVVPSDKPALVSAKCLTYSCNQIKWNEADGADGYLVYRKQENGNWKQIGRTTDTSYKDMSAKVGVTYRYSVAQYWDINGVQAKGDYDHTGLKVTTVLSRPSLKKAVAGKSAVTLKWTKTAGAQGYVVYRKKTGGSYVRLGAPLKGNASVKLTDVPSRSGRYSYKVKAYRIRKDNTYYSAYSNIKTVQFTAKTKNTTEN